MLYGAVVSGSVLAVASVHGLAQDRVAIATGVVALVYWLAHVYVDAVGGRFEDLEHSVGSRLATALRTNTGVLIGSVPPILVFLLGHALGLDVSGAAWLALWSTVVLIVAAALLAGYRAGARGLALAAEGAVAGGFGLVVILLKYLLH
jgi:hypothetical protein